MEINKLVTSKEVSENLKKLGVKQFGTQFAWAEVCVGTDPITHENVWGYRVVKNDFQADLEFIAAYTLSELGELLKPYMKDIEISARDDIFNPDFWGNYLISKLTK